MHSLITQCSATGHEAEVVSLTPGGPTGDALMEQGIKVTSLNCGKLPTPHSLQRLTDTLINVKPDIVQSWLYRSDLMAGLCRVRHLHIPLVWGVHSTNPRQRQKATTALVRLNALLSRALPTQIVYCSHDTRQTHEQIGYCQQKGITIHNGVDTNRFTPNRTYRQIVRADLKVGPDTPLIGLVARFDPIKDHRTFFAASSIFLGRYPAAHFVLCGEGIDDQNPALTDLIEEFKLRHSVHLLGPRNDIQKITAALDIACSTSLNESFSMTLAEAMACGIPCVATNTGGPRELFNNGHGLLVPVGDPLSLADAWQAVLETPSGIHFMNAASLRNHIVTNYSLKRMAHNYLDLYTRLVS